MYHKNDYLSIIPFFTDKNVPVGKGTPRKGKKFFIHFAFFFRRLSILIIILESRHLSHIEDPRNSSNGFDDDIHESHPVLKEKLSSDDKCWKKEPFEIVKECDLCTGSILLA